MSSNYKQLGKEAAAAGKLDQAVHFFNLAVWENPQDEETWLLLAYTVPTKEERKQCLARVLEINPQNQEARVGLATGRLIPVAGDTRNQSQSEPERQKQNSGTSPLRIFGNLLRKR